MLTLLPQKTNIFSLDCSIVCSVSGYSAKPQSVDGMIFSRFPEEVKLLGQKAPRLDSRYHNWLHRFGKNVIFANMQNSAFEFQPKSIVRCFEQLALLRAKKNLGTGAKVKYAHKQIVLPMPADMAKWNMSVEERDRLFGYSLELAEPEFLLWLYE